MAAAGLQSVVITASGTWTVPANVSAIWLYASGGGGSGINSIGGTGNPFAPGAAGEYCLGRLLPVTPSSVITITVGDGGASTSSGSAFLGNPGTQTDFGNLTFLPGGSTIGSASHAIGGGCNPGTGNVPSSMMGKRESITHFGGASTFNGVPPYQQAAIGTAGGAIGTQSDAGAANVEPTSGAGGTGGAGGSATANSGGGGGSGSNSGTY